MSSLKLMLQVIIIGPLLNNNFHSPLVGAYFPPPTTVSKFVKAGQSAIIECDPNGDEPIQLSWIYDARLKVI